MVPDSEDSAARLDAWLRDGGKVVAASERAARALAMAFHRRRWTEGLSAWEAPDIQDWQSFVRAAWEARRTDDRLVLNTLQEQVLWAGLIESSAESRILFEEPRWRMAAVAAAAHRLLCSYAPRHLNERNRTAWQQDAGAFSGWLREFDRICNSGSQLSSARLPLELLTLLEANAAERPPLLLAGFDRILPIQRRLFDAWGRWAEDKLATCASQIHHFCAPDPETELRACALWCTQSLQENPDARLLVLVHNLAAQRGEIERAFYRFTGRDSAAARFEFSLGVPLGKVALVRGALLILQWLAGSLAEDEIDWLFSLGQGTDGASEPLALTGFVRALRRRNLQRTRWRMEDLLTQRCGVKLPQAWVARMVQAQRRLSESVHRRQSPIEWAALVPELLEIAGWPGARSSTSAEFQALRRWQQTLDASASLSFDGCRVSWDDFLLVLRRAAGETLFAPESQDAPIQIAGPAEAAGLRADAIWFLGADEERWPAKGATNPLLPFAIQRDAGMPHSSPQHDLALAESITSRILASAPVVCFSHARQSEGVEARQSRLIVDCVGHPQPLPADLIAPAAAEPATVVVEDLGRVPLEGRRAPGGAAALTSQSQCPFKAFATARLGAQGWEPAQAGLTAAQRGQLLHDVLHAVWAGEPNGICTHEELLALPDLAVFVERHASRVFAEKLPAGVRESMPRRYLELEEVRLTRLVTEWLLYERARMPFAVVGTERKTEIDIAGLNLQLRLDRVDRLKDDSLLVVDYKSGDVATKSWETPRPDDVQLPLYAVFALDRATQPLGGLVFAKVRTGRCCFQGKLWDAKEHLLPSLGGTTNLVKMPLTLDELYDWRACIEGLACDFLAGRADVDPRDFPRTCERCGLQALCRIQEFPPDRESEEDADE